MLPDIISSIQDYTPEALAEYANNLQKDKGIRLDGAALLKEINIEEKKEELNFSSELEIDERFEDAADKL